ncbi:NADH-ubiquinone oxidoreductase-F iron-sulfur binding region domain-containing protein [Streptomyces sp. NPDC001260]|uniref:NADH-ubiquinone oxidoreductase-F iron-sulfur binding region domain-containing protein n=1 Tax=Streptomyces sp. NPDC001260 TaxID=3364551 RepID=UPI0036B6B768
MTATHADLYMPPRLLTPGGTPADLPTHEQRYGPLPYGDPAALLREVTASGLTGRGGAAFPVHRKLAAVTEAARRTGRAPVVVANGAEEAYLAVEEGASYLEAAAAHRADPVAVTVVRLPRRFLSGQASALARFVGGGAALPGYQNPPVREEGVHRAPTLVQNVETLAHLALVARYGAQWFRSAGTAAQPGSALCAVHVPGHGPRVVEAPFGMPLHRLLPLDGMSAVLLGGYHGTWIPAAQAAGLPLDATTTGAGVLEALPASRCGVAETARVLRYLALQSAGQCGPCLNGLPRIAAAFRTLAAPGPQGGARTDVARWAGLVEGRGACHHPDGTVRLVRSAMTTFATELDAHARGLCTATDRTPVLPVPQEA